MKRDNLLKKKSEDQTFELTNSEKLQLSAIINLFQQAQQAQDILYSNLIENVADRLELSGKSLEINMHEVLEKGVDEARLITKDA